MSWDTPKLLNAVKEKYGEKQFELLRPSLNSVSWKLLMAQYHASESKKIIERALPENEENEKLKITKMFFAVASNRQEAKKFNMARFCAEAHIVAFAQALHSVVDIVAQVLIFSLKLNLNSNLSEESNIFDVKKYLINQPSFAAISHTIEKLLESYEFRYLQAYTNVTKHRSLVAKDYTLNFNPNINRSHGFVIDKFTYKGKSFTERWADEFIFDGHKFIHGEILHIGNLINETVVEDGYTAS